ncbi:hypothetical protein Ndes2526B_g00986 [Nannochloris sp. 'desiccata']
MGTHGIDEITAKVPAQLPDNNGPGLGALPYRYRALACVSIPVECTDSAGRLTSRLASTMEAAIIPFESESDAGAFLPVSAGVGKPPRARKDGQETTGERPRRERKAPDMEEFDITTSTMEAAIIPFESESDAGAFLPVSAGVGKPPRARKDGQETTGERPRRERKAPDMEEFDITTVK